MCCYVCDFIVSKIKTRFKSFRTDYVKLKKKVREHKAKSGSSPKKLTRLQQFKLSHGRFLDAFCRPSGSAQEMGPVSIAIIFCVSISVIKKCIFPNNN